MALSEFLLPEYDRETGLTRRVLERVPEDAFTWKPHDKSWTMSELATHVANLVSWGTTILDHDHYNMVDGAPRMGGKATRAEVLALFDDNVKKVRASLAGKTDAELLAPWRLDRNGEEAFSIPRLAAVRSFLINHLVHHRGQLTVYLRLRDVPVPSIYGPSADEQM